MTHDDDILHAELLCARLCHDMAGAVGAAAAGAELLEDGFDAETVQLVAASAASAVARLKFFRAALGPAGSDQPADAVQDLTAAYLRATEAGAAGRLSLRWSCGRPRLAGDVAARSGAEYLAHPGHPLAVVVGHPNEGGGPCHFFDTPEDYRQAGTGAPTDSCWLPQILYRLYAATPSVMMGRPRAQDEGASVGVECNGVTFGRPAPLVERAQVGG